MSLIRFYFWLSTLSFASLSVHGILWPPCTKWSGQLLLMLKIHFFAKQYILMRRSTVLSLPLQQGFPAVSFLYLFLSSSTLYSDSICFNIWKLPVCLSQKKNLNVKKKIFEMSMLEKTLFWLIFNTWSVRCKGQISSAANSILPNVSFQNTFSEFFLKNVIFAKFAHYLHLQTYFGGAS